MKKLHLIMLSLMLLVGTASAVRAQNIFDGTVRDFSDYSQPAYAGALVEVFNNDCTNATISEYPGWPVTGNTLLADANGYFIFLGNAASYTLKFSGGGIPLGFRLRWISGNSGTYSVKDFGATGDGVTDDTRAIASAIAYIGSHNGGRLLFPRGYYLVGNPLLQCVEHGPAFSGFTLPSGISIEGTNGASFSNCLVELVGAGKKLFKIGKATNRIAIRDIKLRATSTTQTVAIFATGPTGSITNSTSSFGFVFSSIYVEGFEKGIHVLGSDSFKGWQFDNIKLQDSFLNGNKVGVLIDTINTDWHIDNCVIGVLPNGVSLQIEHAGAITIHNMYGGGGSIAAGPGVEYPDPDTAAKAYIWIKGQHGPINIQDSECENSFHSLLYDWNNTIFNWGQGVPGYPAHLYPAFRPPLALHNNFFGDRITLRANVVLVTTGNYFNADTVRTVRTPSDGSGDTYPGSFNSQIYSFGDQFAYRTSGNKDCAPVTLGFDVADPADCRREFYLDNSLLNDVAGMNTVVMRSGMAASEADPQQSKNTNTFQTPIRIVSPPSEEGNVWGYTIERNPTTDLLDFAGTAPKSDAVGFQFAGDLYPSEDAQFELGNGDKRWSLVRGVTVVSGDTILSDKTTGAELYRIREDHQNIYFEDIRTGKQMMRLDRDGNLFVQGRVYQRSQRAGKNQQNASGSRKASKLNRSRKR